MTDVQHDYIAFAVVGAGGSWARDPDPREALRRCAKIMRSDWKHLYHIPKTVTLNLYDVAGHDEVSVGHTGCWAGDVRCKRLGSVTV